MSSTRRCLTATAAQVATPVQLVLTLQQGHGIVFREHEHVRLPAVSCGHGDPLVRVFRGGAVERYRQLGAHAGRERAFRRVVVVECGVGVAAEDYYPERR